MKVKEINEEKERRKCKKGGKNEGRKGRLDGQRGPKLSGRSQRYVRRVLLSGIKKRFVI